MSETAERYAALPYNRIITPDLDEGGYVGEILELPGCITEGQTLEELWANLEEAKLGWIEAQLDSSDSVPTPVDLAILNDWREALVKGVKPC